MEPWTRIVIERRASTIFAMALAAFLYVSFGILDWYIFPAAAAGMQPTRMIVVAYLIATIVAVVFLGNFYVRYSQPILLLGVLLAGFGIIWLNHLVSGLAHGETYYAGLILVVAFLFVFLPIRFRYAMALAIVILCGYNLSLFHHATPLPIAISNNFFLISATVVCGMSCRENERLVLQHYASEAVIESQKQAIEVQKRRADDLLHQILPDPIAERLKDGALSIADGYSDVTILFADLAGFTEFSASVSPRSVVKILNQVFSAFDDVAERCGVEKIKTIGDAYMAACGVPNEVDDHPERMLRMALGMREALQTIRDGLAGFELDVRIGIHTGPCVAGVIGRQKFIYDLWGDTVNLASRMESTGVSGQIQVSEATYLRTRHAFDYEARGELNIKGRGAMKAYLLKTVAAPDHSTESTT